MTATVSWFEIAGTFVLVGCFWLWFESTRVREIAVARARRQSHAKQVQFLDDTVALETIKLARDEAGHLTLRRTYGFEYSDTGNNRQPGRIVMLGRVVQSLNFSPQLVGANITLH